MDMKIVLSEDEIKALSDVLSQLSFKLESGKIFTVLSGLSDKLKASLPQPDLKPSAEVKPEATN